MTALLSPSAKQPFTDTSGAPAAGYKLYTYLTGTTTPAATYQDRAGTVANANPIILDARGEAVVYLTPGVVYRYVLKTSDGVTVWTRDDVTANAGEATAVYYTAPGTGMVARPVSSNLALAINVMDAVDPDDDEDARNGVLDCSAAIGLAIDEAISRGWEGIRFPAGRFLVNSKVAKTLTGQNGFSIEGAGMGLTQLIIADPDGNGFEFTCTSASNWWLNTDPSQSVRVANLSILATGNNLGTGLKLSGGSLEGRPSAPFVFDHVEFRAKDAINTQAFLTALWLHDVSAAFFTKCRFLVGGTTNLTPTAVKIDATDATTDPTGVYFDHCEWYYGGRGVDLSDYFEGVYFTQCAMVKCDTAIRWLAPAGGESGLHVIGGHFNSHTRNFDLDGVFDFTITGAVCFVSGSSPQEHVRIDNCGSFTINGNVMRQGTVGVSVGTVATTNRGAFIGGNTFEGMTTGISLAADSSWVRVGDNNYAGVTTRVSGAGGTGTSIFKRAYSVSAVPTLTGGAATEDVNVAIPSGVFGAKPSVIVANAESGSQNIICTPIQQSASTTATNAVIKVFRNDGAVLAAGAIRLHVVAYE